MAQYTKEVGIAKATRAETQEPNMPHTHQNTVSAEAHLQDSNMKIPQTKSSLSGIESTKDKALLHPDKEFLPDTNIKHEPNIGPKTFFEGV
ncbi:hypothetical protein MIDIC_10061 [Alphaproteobacteria bacterium]